MIAPSSSRYSSNDMVHNHYLEEAKKKTQEIGRNSKPSVIPSAKSQSTDNGSKPKPRNHTQTSRNWPASKTSYITTKTLPIAEHSRNSRNFSDSKQFIYLTCLKCVFNANHDSYGIMPTKIELTLEQSQQGVSNDVLVMWWWRYSPYPMKSDSINHMLRSKLQTYLEASDSRIKKAQDLKTKTFANSDIQDLPSRYQVYQGRLLASFQDNANAFPEHKDNNEGGERFINEEVYVAQPLGFIDFEKPDHVYKLKKALYGLKQKPKSWYDRLKAFLIKHEHKMGMVDNTLFTKKKSSNLIIVQIYVDDIIFGSTCQDMCDEFAKIMHDEFEMSMMGELNFFLGLQIKQIEDGIFFNQSIYIKEMLKKFSLDESKPMKTSMSFDTKLRKDEECESVDSTKYRGMIDFKMILRVNTAQFKSYAARFKLLKITSSLEKILLSDDKDKRKMGRTKVLPKSKYMELYYVKDFVEFECLLEINDQICPRFILEFYSQYQLNYSNKGQMFIEFVIQNQFFSYSLEEFAQILDIPCEGACVVTNKWSLDELAYGVPTDGPYQTNPPSPDDIILSIQIDQEGQVCRIRHEEEIDVHEY
ncbi:retrovirus-related pol polyprotein from transposon TNT 1-94 [Tanacetum coccineum]